MEKKDAISKAAEQLVDAENFILVTVHKDRIDNTSFITNAGAAIGILGIMKKVESAILYPSKSPQPSKGIIS